MTSVFARPGVWIPAGVIVLLTLLALLGPALSPFSQEQLDWENMASAPQLSTGHWLGTDRLGRDLFVRALHGVRISLLIGVAAALVSLLIGIVYGSIAGFFGGRVDALMMRFVDVLYALPYIFLVIVLATLFERGNITVLLIAIGAVGWLTMARIVRAPWA